MNIAHIVFGMTVGGIETMLANIASNQITDDNRVGIFIINDLENIKLIDSIDPQVEIIRIKRPVGSKNPLHIITLNRALIRFRPDIIHIHKAKIYNYLLPRFRRMTCVTQHDILIKDDMRSLPRIRHRFAISQSVAKDIKVRLNLDSTVVYNGIYTSRFKYMHTREYNKILKCVCVGRLMHQKKGQDILIKALSLLPSNDLSKICLHFIGEGDSLEYLQSIVADMKLTDHVKFIGLKSQQWLYEHLCDYDLFIAPSVYEGFGLTVAEAMCAGVPVLVSDIQGPMEIIDNGTFGYHFKCCDERECADALSNIINNTYSTELTEKARQHAIKSFDVINTASRYLNEYRHIIQYPRH